MANPEISQESPELLAEQDFKKLLAFDFFAQQGAKKEGTEASKELRRRIFPRAFPGNQHEKPNSAA